MARLSIAGCVIVWVLSTGCCALQCNWSLTFQLVSHLTDDPCIGGDDALTDISIQVQYRLIASEEPAVAGEWNTLQEVDPKLGITETLDLPLLESCDDRIQFRLLQLEHGGGSCNCWRVDEARVQVNDSTSVSMLSVLTDSCFRTSSNFEFCDGLARDARGFISGLIHMNSSQSQCLNDTNELIANRGPSLPQNCLITSTFGIKVSYGLLLSTSNTTICDGAEFVEEAVEFAMRSGTSGEYGPWIPLRLTQQFGAFTTPLNVRGYDVEVNLIEAPVTEKVTICGESLLPANASEVQFRWMNTDRHGLDRHDIWALFDVRAEIVGRNGETLTEISNFTEWQEVRNGGTVCSDCVFTLPCVNNYLTFGAIDSDPGQSYTKIALTQTVNISIELPPVNQELLGLEDEILFLIQNSRQLEDITMAESLMALELLSNLTLSGKNLRTATTLFLLADILRRFEPINTENREDFTENFLALVPTGEDEIAFEAELDVIGSSLLSLIDRFALAVLPVIGNITFGNIIIQTSLISADVEGSITTINSSDYSSNLPLMSIEIPSELVELFAGSSSGGDERVVRVISALYYDVEQLFPRGRPGNNESVLGPGIVSTSLQCGDTLCDTTGISLTEPVIITIQHYAAQLLQNQSVAAECVFWEFLDSSSLLTMGQWSTDGCFKNSTLSSASQTVCECHHLTHFAILLSPMPIISIEDVVLTLETISYIGVAISLVAMAVTIATFLAFRALYNIRSYVHIHLCINLMIAQVIFVVGIDRSAEDHVPVHCQAIAVLLHYFFLVSFMWMLMEGVVLYFILVRVFVGDSRRYIVGFTIVSYGIPLLYMGLTLPLGFALQDQHYGTTFACFLNAETHFIWAFIAPVMLIIFLNVGFLIMAAIALWRQKKSQKREMDKRSIAAWLKTVGFLVVVLGITWLFGVLVLEVDALLPLAYIYAIIVAFQGVAIFLSLVAFQKSVRDEYIKWFKQYAQSSKANNSLSSAHKKSEVITSMKDSELLELEKL